MGARGKITNMKTGRGYLSNAMACDESQFKEFNDIYKRHGIVGAEHKEDGTLEITSRKARAEVMKLRGMIDRDGGYGDYTGS